MGRLTYRAFQWEVEVDYITVSRFLLVPVGKCLRQYWELVSANLSEFILTVGVCSAALCLVWLRSILRSWSWLQF